jgi:SsrA-binding protein
VAKKPAPAKDGKHDAKKGGKNDGEDSIQPIADNRKAFHDYHILETFEAGIALLGTEVKGIREGQANLRDSFARVDRGEVWLFNVHINPYSHRGYVDHDPKRKRRLLLHKYEIRKLIGKTVEKGLTLVPTRMYFKNGKIKVALALARGKEAHDKRETIRRREADRETRAAVKERVRR